MQLVRQVVFAGTGLPQRLSYSSRPFAAHAALLNFTETGGMGALCSPAKAPALPAL
jgi:hypothetical protein